MDYLCQSERHELYLLRFFPAILELGKSLKSWWSFQSRSQPTFYAMHLYQQSSSVFENLAKSRIIAEGHYRF